MVAPKTMIITGGLGFILATTCFMIETFYQPCALGFILALFCAVYACAVLIKGCLEHSIEKAIKD